MKTDEDFYALLDEIYASGEEGAVLGFLTEMSEATAGVDGGFNAEHMLCMCELGSYYRGVGEYEESLRAFHKAEEIIARMFGEDSANYASNLTNTATAYRMMGDTDKALELFLRSIRIYDALPERDEYLYAGALNNIAILYQNTDEYEKAADCLTKAVAILEGLPERKSESATTCANLAALYARIGDDRAEAVLDRAIDLFRSLPHESPHFAAALNSRAAILASKGRYDEAAEQLREAKRYERP
jgi:tetratricopeptide (TPR) repeat protein